MTDWPRDRIAPLFIQNFSRWASGLEHSRYIATAQNSLTWPTANKAIYMPFAIPFYYPVRRVFWMNGSSVTSTNIDFGIYNYDGTKLYSTGSTAASGVSALQFVTPTEFLLAPGKYFFALSDSSITANRGCSGVTGSTARATRMSGYLEEASALPLPAAMTGVASTFTIIPFCGITLTASGF